MYFTQWHASEACAKLAIRDERRTSGAIARPWSGSIGEASGIGEANGIGEASGSRGEANVVNGAQRNESMLE